MAEFKVNNCCGCISLRSGSVTIAILATVFSFISFVIAIVQTVSGDFGYKMSSQQDQINIAEIYPKIAIPHTIIGFLLSLLLLVGVMMSKRKLMLPYLIVSGSGLVTSTYLVLICAIAFPLLLVSLIFIAFSAYLWMVVYSYYMSLSSLPIASQLMYKPDA